MKAALTCIALFCFVGIGQAQCNPGIQPIASSGSGGLLISQSQPSGLFGRRTKTKTTLIVPIGAQQQPVCPPCDDDDDDEVQTELLRQIIVSIAEKRREEQVEEESRENRQLMLLLLEAIKARRNEEVQVLPLPATSRRTVYIYRTNGWRKSHR